MCERFECRLKYAVGVAEKSAERRAARERKADREKKEALKSRRDWGREAQAAVNAYVRFRDEGLPCISCGRFHDGQWHAGHYLSRGAHPELSLDERNIHRQCQPCNVHLSGNQIEYRKGLIGRYGEELVNELEGPHAATKYTVEDLVSIRDTYRTKLRDLKRARASGAVRYGLQ